MTDITVPSPEIFIKDEQSMENIHWENCVLLLKIGEKEIQWAIYKRDTNYFVRICSYSFDQEEESTDGADRLRSIFLKEKIQAEKCCKVKVIVDTPLYTVVPKEVYQEDLKEAYFTSLFGNHPTLMVKTEPVQSKKMQVVYGLQKSLLQYLEQHFDQLSIVHNQSLLLRYIQRGIGDEPVIYATLHPECTSFIVFSEEKPLLIQSYKTIKPLDVVYYILNILKQLDLEKKPVLYLTGYNKHLHFIKEKISSELGGINTIKRPKGCIFPKGMEKYASYYFFHLVYLALCELLAEN